jgi:thiol-disulfide isomerase/thioredoxin
MKQYFLIALGALLIGVGGSITVANPIEHTDDKNILLNLINTEKNIVIKFSVHDCPYCEYLEPIFTAAAQAYQGPTTFVSVMIPNADKPWYKEQFKFATAPTVLYYKDGKIERSHDSNECTVTQEDIKNHLAQVYSI